LKQFGKERMRKREGKSAGERGKERRRERERAQEREGKSAGERGKERRRG
jgi:hypothetical protein